MDWGTTFLLTLWLTGLLLLRQRTERTRRRGVTILLLFVGFLTWYWANYRSLSASFFAALLASIVLAFLFWLLIGRYNPVGSSDSIQVIGMDD